MRLTASPDTSDSLIKTKRTRVVSSQSKYGCFTCRSRRIKCDESKPQCRRCQRSNIQCEGYPLRAYSDSKSSLSANQSGKGSPESHCGAISTQDPQPTYPLLDGFRRSPIQDRLARLGCDVLRDGLHDQFEVSRAVFEWLLPQLSYALPSVNAAAAALGAVYEMQTAPLSTADDKKWLVAAQYGAAVHEVQQDLCNRPYGTVPILVACVLLACVDVLLCRPRIGLLHLRGAIRLLEERNATTRLASTPNPMGSLNGIEEGSTSNTNLLALEEGEDDLTVLFRTLDVQTVLYADGWPPDMQIAFVRAPEDTSVSPDSIHRAGRELIALMQACSCFTSHASQYKYQPQTLVPADLSIEQGRHIATLRLWLRRLTFQILPYIEASTDSRSTAKYSHCLMLRNLCLSTIIYTSTILDPYETGWDTHACDFQEIVTGAESILGNRRRKRYDILPSSTSEFTFTPLPGIIQPLHLAATKYRHPTWRRRAFKLLLESGREGPWDGKLLAAAGQRIIDVEESELGRERDSVAGVKHANASYDDAGKVHLEDIVPERVRISAFGTSHEADAEGIFDYEWTKHWGYMSHVGSAGRRNVSPVTFSRCRDVNKMLLAGLDTQVRGEDPPWRHRRHWEFWTEIVEF